MQVFSFGPVTGLSTAEVAELLAREGYNELPSREHRGILSIVLDVIREPMFILLVASGTIYFFLGDYQEGLMLLSFVFLIIGITVYQEQKTERALDALWDLSSPRALVIRDGEQRRIAGREVVPGDLLILSEGDRVAADALLLYSNNLTVDESLLTGESVPVRKIPWEEGAGDARPGGDNLPFVYFGTLVVQGQGLARVQSTGMKTEMGKIGVVLLRLERGDPALKNEISWIVRTFAAIGLLLCATIVIVYGLTRQNWIEGFLAGITLAMSILPEEFPVILTVFLAIGAWRISKKNVLTRQIPAIETLGSATVLCVDKTGTLTENRMAVRKFFVRDLMSEYPGDALPAAESCHELAEFGILACKRDPFDPMEKALLDLKAGDFGNSGHIHTNWDLVQEYPLSPGLLAMSNVWRSPDRLNYVIAAKGAPEAISDLCHLDGGMIQELTPHVNALAAEGLRVLGVARASFSHAELPGGQHDFVFEFLGLVGFTDPVRPGIAEAVAECYSAGIRVIMITGDYPLTAQNVARQIGIRHPDLVITGPELTQMSDEDLSDRIRDAAVFARVLPEQKLRIVNALKANGEVVAMTGDGVNDAPALKSADIGIAMGGRGTDVARESASLVLLDDNFTSIVSAVRLGRRVYDNLKKAIAYTVSIHVPIAGMSLIPVLLNLPLVLLPVHVVFLELIIDPACSVVFESEQEEADVMDRPPRERKEGLFTKRTLILCLLQGGTALGFVLFVYLSALDRGMDDTQARTLAFTTMVIANLGMILINRSWNKSVFQTIRSPNNALFLVLCGSLASLALVLYIPVLQDLFMFSPVSLAAALLAAGAGILSITWFEVYKGIRGYIHGG